jgi:hypothetical protein
VSLDGNVQLADAEAFKAAFTALGESEVDPRLHRIALEDFPKDIEIGVMEALLPLVQEAPQ